jgi:hypothetical protein
MNMNDLITKLEKRGITATAEQITEALGDVAYLTDADLDAVAEMLTTSEPTPAKSSKKAGKIAKSPSRGSTQLAKVDANNLPEVASLTTGEVTQWIERVEASKADGEAQDNRLVAFLSDLYQHRQQAIELARSAVSALGQQDQELRAVMGDLSATVSGSLQGLQQADSQMAEIAGGAPRLGQMFRKRSDLAAQFRSAIGGVSA